MLATNRKVLKPQELNPVQREFDGLKRGAQVHNTPKECLVFESSNKEKPCTTVLARTG